MSDNKYPQLSITLFCFLSHLSNLFVWMVMILPLFNNYSRPISNHMTAYYNQYDHHPHVPKLFLVLLSDLTSRLCFRFYFIFYSVVIRKRKFSFLLLITSVWLSSWDYVNCLYVRILKHFMSILFLNWFWIAHILFWIMVKI